MLNRYLITLKGHSRFHLISDKTNEDNYIMGEIDWSAFNEDLKNKAIKENYSNLKLAFKKYLKLKSIKVKKLIIFSNMKDILSNTAVLEKYSKEIEHYNSFFSPYERIKKFELIAEPWSVDGGELTATMKLRRKNILLKYQHLSEKIYRENN